ncbi:MAG: DEAD/DEAH box helicase [Gammaproteobacteria bacterium]|nr:DEAD/DEAH box helicase [Gammaproteobacteria bacterium]
MACPFVGLNMVEDQEVNHQDQERQPEQPTIVFPPQLNAQIHSTYAIPIQDLPDGWEESQWYKSFTIIPKESSCSQGPPKILNTTFIQDDHLHLPRFQGKAMFGPTDQDTRVQGEPLGDQVHFQGTLCDTTPPQVTAVTAVLNMLNKEGGATLILPCGFGKTVCALYLLATLGRRTLIVVNSTALLEQWIERIEQFISHATIGIIQQDQVEVDCDIVIGMLQSISGREYDPSIFDLFGTVIVDEAHHIAAPVYSKAMAKFTSRNIIGLTATPDRLDGCGEAIYWLCGPQAFRAERTWEEVNIRMIQYTRGDETELVYKWKKDKNGKPMVKHPEMVNRMVADEIREGMVAQLVSEQWRQGRWVLVICDRRDQVSDIAHLVSLDNPELDVGIILGGKKKRKKGPDPNAEALTKQVIVSTYHYFSEGTDVPRLDTLVFATPRGNIEQAVGRILRPHPDKAIPLVIDVCDDFSLYTGMMWKRHKFYRKFNYQVERMTDIEYFP